MKSPTNIVGRVTGCFQGIPSLSYLGESKVSQLQCSLLSWKDNNIQAHLLDEEGVFTHLCWKRAGFPASNLCERCFDGARISRRCRSLSLFLQRLKDETLSDLKVNLQYPKAKSKSQIQKLNPKAKSKSQIQKSTSAICELISGSSRRWTGRQESEYFIRNQGLLPD